MTDYIKSEGYIYANLYDNVSRALYDAMVQKGVIEHIAAIKSQGSNITSLREIAKTLAELGAHMEVTVKFIEAPAAKGEKE
jgi:hypothetical protein